MELVIKNFDELGTRELYEILRLRVDVFVVEQKCPYPEVDGVDYESLHLYYKNNKEIVAYIRIYEDKVDKKTVHIGRVISKYRGEGLGKLVMNSAIDEIKRLNKYKKINLLAQVYAKGFYEKLGFKTFGEAFLEDGIPHINMELFIK
ncbi:GNAT family N-acetyltransferase [Peptoniphilus sp.]|jgi:ElaA protein|uniref:GNAT family N-acetyltransferase n=1 Tax=Peptoniphilus sp. TaxID=1971214 RepID=UPI003D8CC631